MMHDGMTIDLGTDRTDAALQAGPYRLRTLLPSDAGTMHRLVNDWSVIRMLSRTDRVRRCTFARLGKASPITGLGLGMTS